MTHRILLADDSVTIRKVVELTFSDGDFTIDSVGDGAQALEHARAQRPDIIISDVIMPGLNGYELCQQVKADPELRSVPFLFLKGTFESFDEEKARSCGAEGIIVKPFESQDMIAKVMNLIERAALATPAIPVQAPQRIAAPAVQQIPTTPTPAQPTPAVPVLIPAYQQAPAAPRPVAPSPPPVAARPAAVPPPGFAMPRPVVQQRDSAAPPRTQPRPATAPPPIPTMQVRPMTSPPSAPAMAVRPAPPIPPRPVRPLVVPPPIAPPAVTPPSSSHQPPPTPPPSAPAPSSNDDFGFDFGETAGDRPATIAAQPPLSKYSPALESSEESDDDLWSEVSLRGNAGDLLETRSPAESASGHRADILELTEETGPPLASPAAPSPAPPSVPAAPVAIDPAEIERLVAARVESVVKQVLEPIVSEMARTMIEAISWEVIPELAEAMIRSEIERIRQSTRTD